MINKVNRPASLSLVRQSKHAENDPGSSQGSGMFYDGPPQQESPPQKSPNDESDTKKVESEKPVLSIVSSVEQIGMTEVVKDFLEHKTESPSVNRVGLRIKYASDSSPAKGLLLNKKAE